MTNGPEDAPVSASVSAPPGSGRSATRGVLQRVATNAAFSAVATACRIGVSVFLTPYLIHRLGVDAYGIWVLVLSFSVSGYLSLFSLGLPAVLITRIAEHDARGEVDEINSTFTAGLLAFGMLGIPAAVLLYAFAQLFFVKAFHVPPAMAHAAVTVMTLFAIQAAIELPTVAFTALLDGLQRYDLETLLDFLRSIVFAIGAVQIVRTGHGIVAMAALQLALSVGYCVAAVVTARLILPTLRATRRVTRDQVYSLARASMVMFFLRINAIVYGQMDKTILAAVLSTSVLVHYDLASRFHSVVLLAMGLVSPVVLSPAAALHATGEHDTLRRIFLIGTRVTAWCAVPLAVGLMVLAAPILTVWVGPQFASDRSLVWLFLAYTLFWAMKDVGWNIMIGMNKAPAILRIQLWTTALNLVVSIVATAKLGMVGVLIGTLVGNAAAMIAYVRLYLSAIGLSFQAFVRQVILRIYPQAVVAGALLVLLMQVRPPKNLPEIAVYAASFGAVYVALVATTGLSDDDRELLRRLGGRVLARVYS